MQFRKLILCLGLLQAGLATASPADYIHLPTVEYGEKEIDFKYGSAKEQDGSQSHTTSLGFGYGATEYWFTEVYLKRELEGSEGLTIAEWENKFQLTETGQYFVDVGLVTEIEAPISNGRHEPYEFMIGALFQKEFGKVQLNANALFEHKFGPKDEDEDYVTEIGYQWQAKYRWKPEFEVGMQGMGELGKWNDWEESKLQNHRMGPAIFGKFEIGQKQAIKYNAAMLFGVSDAAPDHTFRMQAEYEF